MVVFPNCKINLGLQILSKRADGFHNLSTVFYPVLLHDALEIIRSNEPSPANNILFSHSGFQIDGNESNNLCIKAYQVLKKDFPQIPAIQMHLHKAIAMGAGLGGGSADAAFTLKLLNEKFQLNLSNGQLINYSLQLGSDCPFFIINKPCIATGRGEIMEPIDLNLSGYQIVLVNPGIHINTGWAFSQLNIEEHISSKSNLKKIISQPIETWKNELKNDFEPAVFLAHPTIKSIKEKLYHQSAIYAAMSGSGSTIFGIFKKELLPKFNFPASYILKTIMG